MGTVMALLVASLFEAGGSPGCLGTFLLAAVAFGLLYQERWTFDASAGRVTRQVGVMGASRATETGFAAIERFRISPHVQGTIPGTEDERAENAAALRGGRGDDGGLTRAGTRSPSSPWSWSAKAARTSWWTGFPHAERPSCGTGRRDWPICAASR